jgi:hypothetical protein
MSEPSTTVTFHLTCPEPRAWLVLKGENREPRVLEMQHRDPSGLAARADLMPGEYRCRYYCGDDRSVIYHGPAHVEGSIESGMDALVSVGTKADTSAPQLVQ